jgi:hypothetical protein
MSIYILLNIRKFEREILCMEIKEDNILDVRLSLNSGQKAKLLFQQPNSREIKIIDSNTHFYISTTTRTNETKGEITDAPILFPIQLFGVGMAKSSSFLPYREYKDESIVFKYSENDLYYTPPPNECSGFQLEVYWLGKEFWGGVQKNDSYYKVKVPIVFGPNGIPVVWKELRVIELPDKNLLGFSVSHCKTTPTMSDPVLLSNYIYDYKSRS